MFDVCLHFRGVLRPVGPLRATTNTVGGSGVVSFVTCAEVDPVEIQTTIRYSITEFAGGRDTELSQGRIHACAPLLTRYVGIGRHRIVGLSTEAKVRMGVESNTISLSENTGPCAAGEEAIVVGDVRTLPLADTSDLADHIVGFHVARHTSKLLAKS